MPMGSAGRAALAALLAACSGAGTAGLTVPSVSPAVPSVAATPTQSPKAVIDRVRARQGQLAFTPVAPAYIPGGLDALVDTKTGGLDPATGGEAVLLEIELRSPATPWRAEVRILQGPAGCCLDAARPSATPNVEIHGSLLGHLDPVQPQYGGPILWWAEHGTYVAISSPAVDASELLRIARSMTPVR